MLVTFRSTATDSITLFGDVASQLLKLMGASGRIPGALTGDDVGVALQRLESAIAQLKAQASQHPGESHAAAPPANNEDTAAEEEEEREPPVEIATRAIPLIGLLRRAAAAKAEVVWEGK